MFNGWFRHKYLIGNHCLANVLNKNTFKNQSQNKDQKLKTEISLTTQNFKTKQEQEEQITTKEAALAALAVLLHLGTTTQ